MYFLNIKNNARSKLKFLPSYENKIGFNYEKNSQYISDIQTKKLYFKYLLIL
jgi:hypothetical protein